MVTILEVAEEWRKWHWRQVCIRSTRMHLPKVRVWNATKPPQVQSIRYEYLRVLLRSTCSLLQRQLEIVVLCLASVHCHGKEIGRRPSNRKWTFA